MFNFTEIYPGTYYIPNAISLLNQKKLVKLYLNYVDDFYVPILRSGKFMSLEMCCFGHHWNPVDYKYYDRRIDIDNEKVNDYPQFINKLIKNFMNELFPEHNDSNFNVLVVNYYEFSGKLGLHVDNSESKETLNSGYPVVSISVGASCLFKMGGFYRSDPLRDFVLYSGDVLMFGNQSRLRYHGVAELIKKNKNPFSKFLNNGRVNFTLRKL